MSARSAGFAPVFQKGVSYVAGSRDAYCSAESNESLGRIVETYAEWVAICISWYQTNVSSYDIRADPEKTPSNGSLRTAIGRAKELGLKVVLKPMIYVDEPNQWRDQIPPSDEWFESYAGFINSYADFAEENEVDLFCVGCDFENMTRDPEWDPAWDDVIAEVRERYSGPITYGADWSTFYSIGWWDSLDYVSIDAYFPLTDDRDPSFDALKDVWNDIADYIEEWQSSVNKTVIFTEIGYRSVNGTNMQPRSLSLTQDGEVDVEEQADCYRAAFEALWNREWLGGFYWWYWETDPKAGGLNDGGYTPQNKPAEDVLADWYQRERRIGGLTWSQRVGLAAAVIFVAFLLMGVVLPALLTRRREEEEPEPERTVRIKCP